MICEYPFFEIISTKSKNPNIAKQPPRQDGMRQLQTVKKRRAAEPDWTLSLSK
jgi:hypothetical protein